MNTKSATVKAYVLLDCRPGTANGILEHIRKLEGVIGADTLWGRYEMVVVVEVPDMDGLETLVCDRIKSIEGVTNTMTQIVKRRSAKL